MLDSVARLPLQCPARMASGDFLLIDNSNSFTKLALASRTELLGAPKRLSTRELTSEALKQALKGWEWNQVVLSSVVPSKGSLIGDTLSPGKILNVGPKVKLGVGID